MENILKSLSSLTEACLSFGLTSFDIDPNFTFLSGVGLFLLYICFLILKSFLLSPWKSKDIQKPQDRSRKKRGSRKTDQRDAEEGQKLQNILHSSLGESYDSTGFRQLLCPDPLCAVCNKAAAQVSHLLSQASQQECVSCFTASETSFVSSPLSANDPGHLNPASQPEPSLFPSIPSPNLTTPLEDLLSPRSLGDSLLPQPIPPISPKVSLDHISRKPPVSLPPLLQHGTQETELVLPSEELVPQSAATLSVVASPNELSSDVPVTKGTDYAEHAMSEASQQQPDADSQSSTKLVHCPNRQLLDTHVFQAPSQGDRRACFIEPRNLPSPSPDVLELCESQERRGSGFITFKHKKTKAENFEKPLTLGEISESVASPQNLEVSLPLAHRKDKSGDPHIYQQHPTPKNYENRVETEDIQLFWGFPSLYSESVSPTTAALGDGSSACAGFNKITTASTASTCPPCPISLSLPKSDKQAWPKILPQSQAKDVSHAWPQAQPQHLVPSQLPSLPQYRICGVHFHRLQNEAQPLSLAEIHRLEFNILQKIQESVWGLPPVVQTTQEGSCSPPPKILLFKQPFRVRMSRTILTEDFPLNEEVRKRLEHHLRKRLIQHFWGLPQRIRQSVSLMSPQTENPDPSDSQSSHGLSWISFMKRQASKDLLNFFPGQSGTLCERSESLAPKKRSESLTLARSESLDPDKGVTEAQTHSPETGPKDHLQSEPSATPGDSLQSDAEADPEHQLEILPGKCSRTAPVSQCQKERDNFLQVHLNRKVKEINKGQIPGTVDRSWHSVKVALPPPEKSPSQMKDMVPLVEEHGPLKSQQESLTLRPSNEKILEDHIKTFNKQMMYGLPQKVEESLWSYITKGNTSHPFSHFRLFSAISEMDSIHRASGSCTRNNDAYSRDKMETIKLIPTPEVPLPAASPVRQQEQVNQMQSLPENKKVLVEDLSRVQNSRKPGQQWTPNTTDNTSQKQPGSDNTHSPEPPTRLLQPMDERLSSNTSAQRPERKRRDWEDESISNGSTEILKEKELPDLQPQPAKVVTTTPRESSSGSHGTVHKSDSTLRNGRPLKGVSVSQDPDTLDSKSQVSRGFMLKSDSGKDVQALDPHDMPLASEEMTSKFQGPSSGDTMASQVLCVHWSTGGISLEQQGPWLPAHISCKSQEKEYPQVAKTACVQATKTGKFGGGDAGLGTSLTRRKTLSVQDKAPEETHRCTPSRAQLPKRQPSENHFTNQIKCFWQWLSPGRRHKEQEKSQAKGSFPLAPAKTTSLITRRDKFCGNAEAQKCMRGTGLVLRKQVGHKQAILSPCPPKHPSSLMKSEKTQHEAQLQAQAKPIQGFPPYSKASCSQMRNAKSYSQGRGQAALEKCDIAEKATLFETSPIHDPEGTGVPSKTHL